MADTATPIATEDTPSSGMIPMQGDPESTTVTAPPQQPIQPGDFPSTGTIPSATMPDYSNPSVMLPHESWWKRALDATASTMAGDQTIHITKDKDGNVTMTHDPSTGGEKWGRIAAAALTGAAAGLANSQGPGGLARAGAAGFQAGAQIPQQREQQAQQQVDFGNKQVMFKANHAMLDQKYIQNAESMRQQNIKFAEGEADRYNAIQKDRADADGYEDLGTFNGVTDLPDFVAQHPEAMKGHTVGDGKYLTFDPIIDPKTGVQTGTHVGLMSQTMGNQPMKNPPPIPQSYYDADSKSIKTRLITPASGIKRNDYEAAVKAQTAANSELAIKVTGVQQKAQAEDLKAKMQPYEIEAKRAAAAESQARAAQIRTQMQTEAGTPEQNAEMMYEGLAAPSQFSKRAKEYNQLVALADDYGMKKYGTHFNAEMSEAKYRANQAVIKDYADGKEADQIQSFNTFLGHAANLTASIQKLRNTKSPLLNMPYNKLRTMAGDPAVAAILPDIEAVRTEYQNFLNNNHALHQPDIKEGREMLNENQGPAQMEDAAKSFAHTALIRTGTLNDRFKRAFHTDVPDLLNQDSQTTLTNYGLGNEMKRLLYASPGQQQPGQQQPAAQPTAPPQAQVAPQQRQQIQQAATAAGIPPDGHAYIVNGKIVGYYERDMKTYHNLPQGAR